MHENLPMRKLALAQGFVVDAAASDADALRVVLDLQPARAASTLPLA